MGDLAQDEIDSRLGNGGTVVTASERAARSVANRFHNARRLEGLTAWPSPTILDWKSFIRTASEARLLDGRLVLNPIQEQSVWAEILEKDGLQAGLLEAPRYRLAAMAMEAHELLCSHAPEFLRTAARSDWQNDAGAFSRWLAAFDERCRADKFISPARLPLELLARLRDKGSEGKAAGRAPLLLSGFDRLLPVQRSVFDAWGDWREVRVAQPAGQINFYEATDDQSELEACARWCSHRLAEDPAGRILVVTQNLRAGRGQIERAFLRTTGSSNSPAFEFSLGVLLSQVTLPRAALLLLRWLTGTLAEHEIDWLFSTSYVAADPHESKALQARMRAIRRRNEQQPNWTLDAWLGRIAGDRERDRALAAWATRINRVRERVNELGRARTALEWAELVPQWLELLDFAAAQPLSSAEFQASRRWEQALEVAGSLGFDGRRIFWREFLSLLGRASDETVFSLESRDAPILITGPAESAALTVDAMWFLGATEDAWPASGATHPLLPLDVQREARMPHANAQLDWDLAQSITARLIASANEVHFSYARQNETVDARPSRLILQWTGNPFPLPAELAAMRAHSQRTVSIEDFSRIPLQPGKVPGGASVLTYQSQCPFKAFAVARLGAENWEPAQAGLTPAQRGQLLHAALHSVWAELRREIPSLGELQRIEDRERFTEKHVRQVFQTEVKPALSARMPARYLQLEQERLTRLIAAWLEYESTRLDFEVIETEVKRTITLAGLSFDLRLDRIDRLNDGTVLVIDYKTGDLKPKVWKLPRPEDIQLPLYAGFAVDEDQLLGGLVFAKIRPDKREFAGHVGAASTTLFSGLKGTHALLKSPLSAEQLIAWRENIEQLAQDFLAGRAEVDPRDPPKTCERCGLQTLCRVHEGKIALDDEDESEGGSGFAETADA